MKCSNHPETEAVDICPFCSRPVCEHCVVGLSGKNYCRVCLEERIKVLPGNAGTKNRFLAFILSLLPGGGYLYLGLMKRGMQTLILFFGSIFISDMARLDHLIAFVVPVLIFYSVFDTQQLLRRMNDGLPVEDRELFDWGTWESKRSMIGAGLLILGLFALVNNLSPFIIPYHMLNRIIPPLLIMGIGVYILYRSTRKGGAGDGNQSGS